jgi:nitrilase
LLAGPLVKEAGILYAQLDTNRARASRKEFDPTGHYSRPDVFSLNVNTTPLSAVRFDSPAAVDRVEWRGHHPVCPG